MNSSKKIILIGFGTSGKTRLATKLSFIQPKSFWVEDLDYLLELKFGRSVSEVVSDHGWDFFRREEKMLCLETLSRSGNGVLALGGGTLESLTVEEHKKFDHHYVWLKSSFENCWQKGHKEADRRPLFRGEKEELLELYLKREKKYRTWADQVFDVDEPTGEEELLLYILNFLR